MYCSTGNHGQSDAAVICIASSSEAQASVHVTRSSIDDDIYSVVSDDSIGLQNSRPDNQSSHALPYEIAVFQGQSLSDGTQILQHKIDSKTAAALQPYDEVDYSNHNEQHRDGQTCTQISDEHYMYEEVTHEAKGQSKSIVSLVSETREGNDKEATTASELFDDMVYDVTFHVKSTTNMGEDHTAEPTATKKRKDQPRFDDEHVYDSANQLSKGQTVTPPINNDNTNGEADGSKHTYHSLEQSENGKFSSHSVPIDHEKTIVQETNSQSGDCDSTLFDDPMYDSNPQPGADLTVTATPSSTKSDVTELKDDELSAQGNPELPQNYRGSGNAENLPSVYDMFDDPTYIR
jgi:disulfide oxidoreductase YuzD